MLLQGHVLIYLCFVSVAAVRISVTCVHGQVNNTGADRHTQLVPDTWMWSSSLILCVLLCVLCPVNITAL